MNEIRDIHEPFIRWLNKLEIPFHRNRPDKKTTAIKGDPDFLVTFMSRCCYIECKVPGNKLSEAQEKRVAYLRRSGNKVVIAYSLEECTEACKNILVEGNAAQFLERDLSGGTRKLAFVAAVKPLGEKVQRTLGQAPHDQVDGNVTTERQSQTDIAPAQNSPPANGKPPFCIAHWDGKAFVMAKSHDKPGYEMIREASVADVIALPALRL